MDMMQLYECWSKVVGYWNAAEGQYAVPDMMDSHTAVFRYDIWDTEADSGEGIFRSGAGWQDPDQDR